MEYFLQHVLVCDGRAQADQANTNRQKLGSDQQFVIDQHCETGVGREI